MKRPTKIELLAQHIIQREMKRQVMVHDDGSQPGMYDLRVGDAAAPDIAIECTGAVDPIRTQTWNIGPAKGPLSLAIAGDWIVNLRPNARVDRIHAEIEALLHECEARKLTGFLPVDSRLKRLDSSLFSALDSLRIDSVDCFRPHGQGEVHLGMTGIGGAVDRQGTEVPGWISSFLRAPQRADVLSKLNRSSARECHVFVPVSFGGVPWSVESYLGRPMDTVPSSPPDLPAPITAVWIMYGANGLRWDGVAWSLFDASDL